MDCKLISAGDSRASLARRVGRCRAVARRATLVTAVEFGIQGALFREPVASRHRFLPVPAKFPTGRALRSWLLVLWWLPGTTKRLSTLGSLRFSRGSST